MKETKDNFSSQSEIYKKFRPLFPKELYDFILSNVPRKNSCWDCGTGNGQVANILSNYFDQVYATDISQKQLDNSIRKHNIEYKLCRAEVTDFKSDYFDLITVGQAIHWFDFELFYNEVRRVAKNGCYLAVFGYGLFRINDHINPLIDEFYTKTIGNYWDNERIHIDNNYESINFPFKEVNIPENFKIKKEWSLNELEGYLNTWSSVQKYIKIHKSNPVLDFILEYKKYISHRGVINVMFPVFLKMGVVTK